MSIPLTCSALTETFAPSEPYSPEAGPVVDLGAGRQGISRYLAGTHPVRDAP